MLAHQVVLLHGLKRIPLGIARTKCSCRYVKSIPSQRLRVRYLSAFPQKLLTASVKAEVVGNPVRGKITNVGAVMKISNNAQYAKRVLGCWW